MLGNLALALHDTGQAREILRSALTLARKLNDIPTQNWVITNMTGTSIINDSLLPVIIPHAAAFEVPI